MDRNHLQNKPRPSKSNRILSGPLSHLARLWKGLHSRVPSNHMCDDMSRTYRQGERNKKDVHYFRNCTNGINWLTSPSSLPSSSDHGDEWRAAFDENSGFVYFYNKKTKETTWKKPANFKEWRAVEDVGGGNVFYYNVLTRTTSKNRPAECMDGKRRQTNTEDEQVKRVGHDKYIELVVEEPTGQKKSTTTNKKSALRSSSKVQNDENFSLYSSLFQGISPLTDYDRVEKILNHLDCPCDEKTSIVMQWLKHLVPSQQKLENEQADSHPTIKTAYHPSLHERDPPVINIIRNGRLRVQYL